MERIIVTIIVFFFIYLLYYITVLKNKQKMETFEKSGQASFIIKKYKLEPKKLDKKKFARSIALTFLITDFIENYIVKLLVGFVILIPLIILGYHYIGQKYKKKEVNKYV